MILDTRKREEETNRKVERRRWWKGRRGSYWGGELDDCYWLSVCGRGSKAKCSAQPDKKVYYFKGRGIHYSLHSKYTWINSRITDPITTACRVECWSHMSWAFVWTVLWWSVAYRCVCACRSYVPRTVCVCIATTTTLCLRDSVPETTGLTRGADAFYCTFWRTYYTCIHSQQPDHNYSQQIPLSVTKPLCNRQVCHCWSICDKELSVWSLCVVVLVLNVFHDFPWRISAFLCHSNSITSMASCWEFEVGVCCVIPAEETSVLVVLPATIYLKRVKAPLACPLWQNPAHSDVWSRKLLRQLHE